MKQSVSLQQVLQHADLARKGQNWKEAQRLYAAALRVQPQNAVIAHNLALCDFALEHLDDAIQHARAAVSLNPALWQSALILAKALAKRDEKKAALTLLQQLHAKFPQSAEIRMELANLTLHFLGDAYGARQLIAAIDADAGVSSDAEITRLVTQLYDRDDHLSAGQVNSMFLKFGGNNLSLERAPDKPGLVQSELANGQKSTTARSVKPSTRNVSRRLRIGLLSPQFFASPVYFFAFGALQQMAGEADLIFISRGTKQDWATQAFRKIAVDWLDVASLPAQPLARRIEALGLDALIDLGGWMDPVALRALSVKPAARQFKWVGGQSVTTGLKTFDGFLTDRYQTPAGSDHLYSEPLIRLKSGYVTYMPPPYLPEPEVRSNIHGTALGVISNPAKVSRAFLSDLSQRYSVWATNSASPVTLRFIDKRYQSAELQQRVKQALPGIPENLIEFITPASHLAYLTAVRDLDATLDTFPYSGGLTTIEALAVGVPSYTHIGELFCERHTVSHCKYAGMRLAECRIDNFSGIPKSAKTGKTLLQADSLRLNHVRLAEEILSII